MRKNQKREELRVKDVEREIIHLSSYIGRIRTDTGKKSQEATARQRKARIKKQHKLSSDKRMYVKAYSCTG